MAKGPSGPQADNDNKAPATNVVPIPTPEVVPPPPGIIVVPSDAKDHGGYTADVITGQTEPLPTKDDVANTNEPKK
jgi:hypothetical protein